MPVWNTASPAMLFFAPKHVPVNSTPSFSTSVAGVVSPISVEGHSTRIRRRHPRASDAVQVG